MWLLAWSFAGWACLDLNQGPLPYQFKDSPRSEVSTSLRSSVAVSLMAPLCGYVAVTAAVSGRIDPLPEASGPKAGHPTASGPKTLAKMAFHSSSERSSAQ
jgi:hypothetical protein